MERQLDAKMDKIMKAPGVVGAIAVDKRGLCLSDSPSSSLKNSSKPTKNAEKPEGSEDLLAGTVKSASYNIVFQISIRIFTFLLNAFILRHARHEVLGVVNVRLALLWSSITFLSREPFRRAALRRDATRDSWPSTINLIWLSLPCTIVWSLIFGVTWTLLLEQPQEDGYTASVIVLLLALLVDAVAEVPYVLAQLLLQPKLRIVAETTLILVRSGALAFAVVKWPSQAVLAYALGSFVAVILTTTLYYGYFVRQMASKTATALPFKDPKGFLPTLKAGLPSELTSLSVSFFKGGVVKQALTEGERLLMTFFDVGMDFAAQGIYDTVANLGSLAARFVLLPVEEASYAYFAQALHKRDPLLPVPVVLGNVIRLMSVIGLIAVTFGIPFASLALQIYGGESLASAGTTLLQANCVYVAFLALNGVTEAFAFAAMDKQAMDGFNKKLVGFSCIFLGVAWIATKALGPVGFYVANCLNMALRIAHSAKVAADTLRSESTSVFGKWIPDKRVLGVFFLSSIVIHLSGMLLGVDSTAGVDLKKLIHFGVGGVFGLTCLCVVFLVDKEMVHFFKTVWRKEKAA